MEKILEYRHSELKRLDVFLKEEYPDFSRSYFKKLVLDGDILVNSMSSNVGYKLKNLDEIKIFLGKIKG